VLLDIPHADGALLLGWAAAAGIRAGGGDRNSLASEGSEKFFSLGTHDGKSAQQSEREALHRDSLVQV
jgi:hypothetical protein